MFALGKFLREHESWLMRRIRDYARERDYTRFTSTLEEAWRVSVSGLTTSIEEALQINTEPWELGPDEDYVNDPLAAFGVKEANLHRARGITLEMFLGLMKYYRQSYQDLIRLEGTDQLQPGRWGHFIDRVFDRIEIAFCVQWTRNEGSTEESETLMAANRAITNEKNKFLTVFETLPTAVFLIDDKNRIINLNQTAHKLLRPDAPPGCHYYSTSDDCMPFPWLAEELSSFRSTGEEKDLECKIDLPGGEERWMMVRFRYMQDVSLKFTWTVVIFKDISRRINAEQENRSLHMQLMQQEKLASVGQLAAGVAHEINNPVGYISGNLSTMDKYIDRYDRYVEYLEGRLLSGAEGDIQRDLERKRSELKFDHVVKDARLLVEESLEGTARIKRIVQDLKSFSRADSGVKKKVDINECLESAINITWNEIKYSAELKRDFEVLPSITCNAQQLNQVFVNLLVNAAHAVQMNGGTKGEIIVRTRSSDDAVHVSVSDNGCGMANDVINRIFDPFFTTKEVGKGTGLGLSISMGIIREHKGTISVESNPGKGSVFTVDLPLA